MNNQYIHISESQALIKTASSESNVFPIEDLKKCVGDLSGEAWIECVYNQFEDRNLIIVCDEQFNLKPIFAPQIITSRGIKILGGCVITKIVTVAEEERDIGYLTEQEALEVYSRICSLFVIH